MNTSSPEFKSLDQNIKPKAEEKLACDGCQNAVGFALKDEIRFFCKIMHTITWTSTERTAIVVCTDQLLEPQLTQQATQQETTIEDFPEFAPDTRPFNHNN